MLHNHGGCEICCTIMEVLCIPSNVCFPHGRGKIPYFFQCTTFLMVGTAGIAAEKCSHVKYFPNRAAYDDYYDIVVDICEVGVDSFATRIQEMLVDNLRDKHGDKVADWCRDFWTGERGRMCLVGYGVGYGERNCKVAIASQDRRVSRRPSL